MTRRRGRKYPPSSRSGRAGWPNGTAGWPSRKPDWRPRPGSGSWRRNWQRDKKRDKQQGAQLPAHDLGTPTRPQGQAVACPFFVRAWGTGEKPGSFSSRGSLPGRDEFRAPHAGTLQRRPLRRRGAGYGAPCTAATSTSGTTPTRPQQSGPSRPSDRRRRSGPPPASAAQRSRRPATQSGP